MPFKIELYGSNKGILVNRETGKHYSTMPIPLNKVKAQQRIIEDAEKKKDPCYSGYKQYGMKIKNGRKVPNCVPNN